MTEQKRNRLIAAVTVNVILLIAILAAVCIYQLVQMVTLKKLENSLVERIEYCNSQDEGMKATLEYFKSEQGLLDKAYEYGFVFEH